jgi:hypothetical protein
MGIQCRFYEFLPTSRNFGTNCAHIMGNECTGSNAIINSRRNMKKKNVLYKTGYNARNGMNMFEKHRLGLLNKKLLYLFPVSYLYSGFHIWKMVCCGKYGFPLVLLVQFSMGSASRCEWSSIYKPFCWRDYGAFIIISRYHYSFSIQA